MKLRVSKNKVHLSLVLAAVAFVSLALAVSGSATLDQGTISVANETELQATLDATPVTDLETIAILKDLYNDWSSGVVFVDEESMIIRRFVMGLPVASIEIDALFSQALLNDATSARLTDEQSSILNRYQAYRLLNEQEILEFESRVIELEAGIAAAVKSLPGTRAIPPNDDCPGAEVIPAAGPFPYLTAATDLVDATHVAGTPPNPSCQTSFTRSVWYTFTPAVAGVYTISSCQADAPLSTRTDPVMAIYTSPASCTGPFTEVPTGAGFDGCDDDNCTTLAAQSIITTQLNAATEYFIVMFSYGTTAPVPPANMVQLYVNRVLPPANDTCAGAVALTLNRSVAGQINLAAANDYQLPTGSTCFTGIGQTVTTAIGRDVVYTFTPTVTDYYSVRVDTYSTSNNLVLYVAGDCPMVGAPPQDVLTCLGAANRHTAYHSEEVMCLNLTAATTYYIYVDELALTNGSSFNIVVNRCVPEVEPNNDIATSMPIANAIEGSISVADLDYYSLGVPTVDTRIFALVDAMAANVNNFDLRVTDATQTLEWDDGNNDTFFGSSAPNIAGRKLPAVNTYLRVNYNGDATAAEPYRLYYVVQPVIESAIVETEPNGTAATANSALLNYFSGTLPTPAPSTDVDYYAFQANVGDRIFIGLDGDPLRNNTPIQPRLELRDSSDVLLLFVNDTSTTSSTTDTPGPLHTSSTPFSTAEAMTWTARYTGKYYVRVIIGTTSTSAYGAGDYLLSIAKVSDCPKMTFAPATLPNGSVGTPYFQTISSNGVAPVNFSIFSGTLPTGMSLASNGDLAGTPTDFGTFNFTVSGIGADSCSGLKVYSLFIGGPEIVTDVVTVADDCPLGGTGDADGIIDQRENISLTVTAHNSGTVPITNISAVLSTTDPLMTMNQANSAYPNMGVGDPPVPNNTLFAFYVDAAAECGRVIPFSIQFTADQGTWTRNFNLTVGVSGNVISENFDTGGGAAWTFENAGLGNNWALGAYYCSAGTGLYYMYNSANDANAWAFSPAVALQAGITYTLGFNQRVASATFPERLSVWVGAANNSAGMTIGPVYEDLNLTNTACTARAGTFTVPTTGNYYIGFHCISLADQYYLVVDDVAVNYCVTHACCPTITLDPASLPDGYPDVLYTETTITASGNTGSYTVAVSSGSLPPGLSLTPAGVLSGTPTGTYGVYNFAVTATYDDGCSGSRSYSITILEPDLAFDSSSIFDDVCVLAGAGEHNGIIDQGETVTLDVSLENIGTLTATGVSGTLSTTTAGITVTVPTSAYPDIAPAATQVNTTHFAFTVDQWLVTCGTIIEFNLNVTVTGGYEWDYAFTYMVGSAVVHLNQDFTEETFPPTGWTSYNLDGGATVWARSTARSYSAPAAALHTYSTDPATGQDGWLVSPDFAVPVGSDDLTFWENVDWASYYGKHSLWVCNSATDCTTPPTNWTEVAEFAAPTEDTWVQRDVSLTAYDGTTIKIAFRYEGYDASSWYIDDVNLASFGCTPCTPTCPQISLLPRNLPAGNIGVGYSQEVNADGTGAPETLPYGFSVTAGSLPPGLALGYVDDDTCSITGTPTTSGIYVFTITADDANPTYSCTGSREYTIEICGTMTIAPANMIAYPEVPFVQTLSTTGGAAPYTYAVTNGALPAGLSLSTAGVISGVTTDPNGNYAFEVTVTDRWLCTTAQSLNILVYFSDLGFGVDDGSIETSVGYGGTGTNHFMYFNRFSPTASEFPFVIDSVQVPFLSSQSAIGHSFRVVILTTAGGDAEVPNAVKVYEEAFTVTELDTWQTMTLTIPPTITGPGDVLVGIAYDSDAPYPASMDTTASQVRSWVADWAVDCATGPWSNPTPIDWATTCAADLVTIDSLGIPGNWMIRFSAHSNEVSPTGAIFPARLEKSAVSPTGYYLYFQKYDNVTHYNLYEGAIGTFYSHGVTGNICSMVPTDLGTGEMQYAITPGANDSYYLVTAAAVGGAGYETISGYDSAGTEIPPALNTCAP